MKRTIYRFDDFTLNPLARELDRDGERIQLAASAFDCLVYLVEHRERPVGKDELISAVWGRVDVSDNLLAQTMVRLRRALSVGRVDGEQTYIKTVSRVGYRWMPDTTVDVQVSDETLTQVRVSDEGVSALPDAVPPGSRRRLRLRPWLWITGLVAVIAAWGYWRSQPHVHATLLFNQGTSVVLPAEVNATEEWAWLHLGLMDLIRTDLRQAKIPVESTSTVLGLISGGAPLSSFVWVIHPRVTLVDSRWQVHLDATSANGRTRQAEASSDDVLKAAHSASDLLMAQMGIATEFDDPIAAGATEEYLMRMDAALYAGSIDAARDLIDKAPPDIREMPEFGYAKAAFHCNQGEYDACKQELADVLKRLPADRYPVLRGRTLAQQWYVYYREHRYAEGEAVLGEAIQLLQRQKETGYLAFAYAERAELEKADGKLDQAQTDFGLARVNYALAGDTAGAYGIDESLAELSMMRGQFTRALPVIERAYDQYQRMGMRSYLPGLLQDMVISQRMLLQYPEELAVTDRYWPFEQKHWDITEDITRHVLVYERALALADNGRTIEASGLLEPLLTEIKRDPAGEPGLKGAVEASLAKFALQRGNVQGSQAWISRTFEGKGLESDSDKRDYANAWLTSVMVAQRAAQPAELKRTVSAMQSWATTLSNDDEGIAVLVMRAQAMGAWSAGQREQALSELKQAMDKANQLGDTELIIDLGQVYAQALLIDGKINEAVAVGGVLSTWSQLDWRAAWTQACVYRALGQMALSEQYRQKAHELAGDRVLPTEASVMMY